MRPGHRRGPVFAATLEDWTAPRGQWEPQLREGTDRGRGNNVGARLLFAAGEELVLRFEERDGIAKVALLDANGLHVEMFHVLTFT